jgi:hypothetical protein
VIELVRDRRQIAANRAARRFDVEYESLRELGELLPALVGYSGSALDERKVRAMALPTRVRDEAVRASVERLVVNFTGTPDQVGGAVRVVGRAMREL